MRRILAVLLIAIAVINAFIAVSFDVGTMRARVQIATRHATLLNACTSPLHHPAPDLGFVTPADLKACPEKVRKQYEELAALAYTLTNPDQHWPMLVSLFVSACLAISVLMSFKRTTEEKNRK